MTGIVDCSAAVLLLLLFVCKDESVVVLSMVRNDAGPGVLGFFMIAIDEGGGGSV
jgi:hypothetical protein